MRITTYRAELNEDLHNILVKENSCNYLGENLTSPEAIVNMLNSVYRLNKQAEEHLYMIAFNTKNKPIGIFEISHGTVNSCICNPRDIFIKALLCGATYIVLAHNHPSQDYTPSNADFDGHKRVSEAGKLIGINLLGNGYYSFKENNVM